MLSSQVFNSVRVRVTSWWKVPVSMALAFLCFSVAAGWSEEKVSEKVDKNAGCESGYTVGGVYQMGRFVMLSDASKWEVKGPSVALAFYWQAGDAVSVCEATRLYNQNADNSIQVQKIE